MPVLEWNVSYLTGVKEIDQHRRHLVDLLNELYAELKSGTAVNTIQSIVEELVKYADYHFSCEEQLMVATSYPGYAEHKKEHEIFTDRAIEFQNGFKSGKVPAVAVLSFLSNWITHHILQSDVKFGAFLDSRNILKKFHASFDSKKPSPS